MRVISEELHDILKKYVPTAIKGIKEGLKIAKENVGELRHNLELIEKHGKDVEATVQLAKDKIMGYEDGIKEFEKDLKHLNEFVEGSTELFVKSDGFHNTDAIDAILGIATPCGKCSNEGHHPEYPPCSLCHPGNGFEKFQKRPFAIPEDTVEEPKKTPPINCNTCEHGYKTNVIKEPCASCNNYSNWEEEK